MDKMREEFEAWINSETGFDCFRTSYPMTKPEDQQYMCHRTNLAWLSWQASRAALRVELPGAWRLAEHEYKRQVEESLDGAGVSYE